MKGLAVVATAPWQVELREVPLPTPGPEDVVVRVHYSWISNGTEGSFIRGERIAGDIPWRAGDPLPFPHVPGYQKVGVAEWVGRDVTHVTPGDQVFASISRVYGQFFDFAGHVSPAVTHRSQVWRLGRQNPIAASGAVLTQVGLNTGMRAPTDAGERAVVIGDGLVGHWTAQTLKSRGCRVLLVGKHPERTALFDAGAGDAITLETDVLAAVQEWASEPVSILAHTAGSLETVRQLLPTLRHGGHVVTAGFVGTEGCLDVQAMRDQELTVHAVSGWNYARMEATLAMIAEGRLEALRLITHRFPVHCAPEAYGMILRRTEPHLGVVLHWEDQ